MPSRSRRSHFVAPLVLLLAVSALTLPAVAVPADTMPEGFEPSAAYEWLDVALEATAREVDRNGARPTINSRTLAIAVTAMYDAWAAYDDVAAGTRFGTRLRRPEAERTQRNQEIALAYATYRALVDTHPEDKEWLDEQMRLHGFDPDQRTEDLSRPEGVGNVAARAVCEYRHRDGSNPFGDEIGSTSDTPYGDYTLYHSANETDRVHNPDRWQPLPFTADDGTVTHPGFLTPHWYRVTPFALESSAQFRPPAPPKVGSDELRAEIDEVLEFNANLTPEEKALVEFMRDGPRSTGQAGHWLKFAQEVSKRDRNDLDRDVKLYFTVGNVAMDAFIASWEAKRYYDTSRPWTLVRHYYGDQEIRGWAGPGKGVMKIPASEWHPYSPYSFVSPPFPSYPSGHSTVSAACARALEHFTGSDTFGIVERRRAGALTEADADCAAMQGVDGRPGAADTECEIELELPTFSQTADMAGISRILGGYHIQSDNIEGLAMGREVADFVWPRIRAYWRGDVDGEVEPLPVMAR